METPFLSLIIPVLDEAENVAELAREIAAALDAGPWSWECLWIDDGSADGTAERLREISWNDGRHRLIEHSRNFGQSAALATGFKNARGAIFVTLDGDGQNDPASIPALVRCLLENKADMVNDRREKRKDNFMRRAASRIANGFRNMLLKEQVRDVGCSLRAFRRECVEGILVFKGMHRFFPALVRMAGHSLILEMPVKHRPRKHGRTKYGILNRLWVGIMDALAIRWLMSRVVRPEIKE